MNLLEQACYDIITKNMNRQDEKIYLLYDTESPLAKIVSSAYVSVLEWLLEVKNGFLPLQEWQKSGDIIMREFKNPPQPLYRGWMVNPENPHAEKQNRVITSHNIDENKRVWLNHHEVLELKTTTGTSLVDVPELDPQIESIKNELITLPKGSIVILVQSTNFRLSTFRIRLELFHRGIHVVEHNHLAYIPEDQFPTFCQSLSYRTDEYVRIQNIFAESMKNTKITRIQSVNGNVLEFWLLENIRGNTGDYTECENKGGTFPIWEIFTEAIDLEHVNGKCLIDTYPREDFSIEICEPFELVVEKWRVLPSQSFPLGFQKLYDWIAQYEGEVMVRELWFWLNPAISTSTPLADINFHERKLWVHLSLGKKHGIYGKKLPKTEVQRFHIDVFVALDSVFLDDAQVFCDGKWSV